MKSKISVDELTRLAFLYAEQDRRSFAEANVTDSPEQREAFALADKFRDYRIKHWGKTRLEVSLENTTSKPIEFFKKHNPE